LAKYLFFFKTHTGENPTREKYRLLKLKAEAEAEKGRGRGGQWSVVTLEIKFANLNICLYFYLLVFQEVNKSYA